MQLVTIGAVAHCACCSDRTCFGQMAVFTAHEYKKIVFVSMHAMHGQAAVYGAAKMEKKWVP